MADEFAGAVQGAEAGAFLGPWGAAAGAVAGGSGLLGGGGKAPTVIDPWDRPRPALFVGGVPVITGGSFRDPILSKSLVPALQGYYFGQAFVPGQEEGFFSLGGGPAGSIPKPAILVGGLGLAGLLLMLLLGGGGRA